MTNFQPNTSISQRSSNSATVTIAYILCFLMPVISLGIGIAYNAGNFDERSKKHGTRLIVISLIVGFLVMIGRLSNPY